MRRLLFLLPLLLLALVVFLFTRGLDPNRNPASLPSALIGKPAPEFRLPGLADGEPGLTNANFAGEVAIVNFFASWCAPCRAEHPLLRELAALPGARLFGIAYKDARADARNFLAELGNPFQRIGADESGRIGIEFGISGVPETFVIDRNGIVRYRLAQPLDPARMEDEIKPLVAELAAP